MTNYGANRMPSCTEHGSFVSLRRAGYQGRFDDAGTRQRSCNNCALAVSNDIRAAWSRALSSSTPTAAEDRALKDAILAALHACNGRDIAIDSIDVKSPRGRGGRAPPASARPAPPESDGDGTDSDLGWATD